MNTAYSGSLKPDLNIVLHVPADVAYELVGKRSGRGYPGGPRDIHEEDPAQLKRAESVYLEIAQLFPLMIFMWWNVLQMAFCLPLR